MRRNELLGLSWDDLDAAKATLSVNRMLVAAGVPVKVVSERLGHATPRFTIETYQHVLPGMQPDAARGFEQLIVPGVLPAAPRR